MGREIKFKPATFYLGVADHIARAVEGQQLLQSQAADDEESQEIMQETERVEMAESLGKGDPGRESRSSEDSPLGDSCQPEGASSKRRRSGKLEAENPNLRL